MSKSKTTKKEKISVASEVNIILIDMRVYAYGTIDMYRSMG